MYKILASLLILTCSLASHADDALVQRMKQIQADPATLQEAVKAGHKAAFFCANCHGDQGYAKTTDVPNLSGQHPTYLLEQIRKFASGERINQFMQGLIKVLSDEERMKIALFYATMSVKIGKFDSARAQQGKPIYDKLCKRCHFSDGHGNETIPRLAGQQVPYLITSVSRYRDGTGIRNDQMMAIATAKMKDEDILNVAHYLSSLP